MSKTRSYNKKVRAESERETGKAILDAALKSFSSELFDRVTLNEIARNSGVTVQTVIRRFGSKEDLFQHLAKREEKRVISDREVFEDKNLQEALKILVKHYEKDGDMMINLISQEQLFEPIRKIVQRGRRIHREWVEKHCSELISGLNGRERKVALYAAIAATDLSTWKLLRRDYKLQTDEVVKIMNRLINGLIGGD